MVHQLEPSSMMLTRKTGERVPGVILTLGETGENEERLANFRLIAAAPEMFQFLHRIDATNIMVSEKLNSLIEDALRLIAKATLR